jgi:hypothetical protein
MIPLAGLLVLLTGPAVLADKIAFIPLDERFTTRDLFLNLAQLTPYQCVPSQAVSRSESARPQGRHTAHRRHLAVEAPRQHGALIHARHTA